MTREGCAKLIPEPASRLPMMWPPRVGGLHQDVDGSTRTAGAHSSIAIVGVACAGAAVAPFFPPAACCPLEQALQFAAREPAMSTCPFPHCTYRRCLLHPFRHRRSPSPFLSLGARAALPPPEPGGLLLMELDITCLLFSGLAFSMQCWIRGYNQFAFCSLPPGKRAPSTVRATHRPALSTDECRAVQPVQQRKPLQQPTTCASSRRRTFETSRSRRAPGRGSELPPCTGRNNLSNITWPRKSAPCCSWYCSVSCSKLRQLCPTHRRHRLRHPGDHHRHRRHRAC